MGFNLIRFDAARPSRPVQSRIGVRDGAEVIQISQRRREMPRLSPRIQRRMVSKGVVLVVRAPVRIAASRFLTRDFFFVLRERLSETVLALSAEIVAQGSNVRPSAHFDVAHDQSSLRIVVETPRHDCLDRIMQAVSLIGNEFLDRHLSAAQIEEYLGIDETERRSWIAKGRIAKTGEMVIETEKGREIARFVRLRDIIDIDTALIDAWRASDLVDEKTRKAQDRILRASRIADEKARIGRSIATIARENADFATAALLETAILLDALSFYRGRARSTGFKITADALYARATGVLCASSRVTSAPDRFVLELGSRTITLAREPGPGARLLARGLADVVDMARAGTRLYLTKSHVVARLEAICRLHGL